MLVVFETRFLGRRVYIQYIQYVIPFETEIGVEVFDYIPEEFEGVGACLTEHI
jgi:hypothetical protein